MSNQDLHVKYRPESFDEMIGQDHVVQSLRALFTQKTYPHAYLFIGSSGCGKTTSARIVAKMLGCNAENILEIDAASYGKVEDIRELVSSLNYATFGDNPTKFIIVDECFVKGSLVTTPNGFVAIETLQPDDLIKNPFGTFKISNVFENKVPLKRLVRVNLANGKQIFCSNDHLFFTDKGWIEAKNLNHNAVVFSESMSYDNQNSMEQTVMQTRQCAICGNSYVGRVHPNLSRRVCSANCHTLFMEQQSNKIKPVYQYKCQYCGKEYTMEKNFPTRKTCSRACGNQLAGQKRKGPKTAEIRAKMQIAQQESRSNKPEIWEPLNQRHSERMKENNPFHKQHIVEKMKDTKIKNGTLNTFSGRRGGNGYLTVPQVRLLSALGWNQSNNKNFGTTKVFGTYWKPEAVICTECSWKDGKGFPPNYKVDIGSMEKNLAIEVDGRGHISKSVIEKDLKKEQKLMELGWTVLRVTNEDIMMNLSQVLLRIANMMQTL